MLNRNQLVNCKFFEPTKVNDKIVVKPPAKAMEHGIAKWNTSLVGQCLDKPLPYFLVKKTLEAIWSQIWKSRCVLSGEWVVHIQIQ